MTSKINPLFLAIYIFLASCGYKHRDNVSSKDMGVVVADTTAQKRLVKSNSSDEDTLFKDSNAYILGSKSAHGEDAISYVGIRFKPYIRFSDFPAKITNNQIKAPIQSSSNPLAKEYRTAISTAYGRGVNFGGHYTFVEWGCGTECQFSVLVDVNTGIVYDGTDGSLGYEFRKNSRMIIVNPPDSTGFYENCGYCVPLIYIWNEKNKKFEQR